MLNARIIEHKEKPAEIEALLMNVGREDPFLPGDEKQAPAKGNDMLPEISGITVEGSGNPLVIIDDVFLREGDIFRSSKIVRIKQKSVIIEKDGKESEVRLGEIRSAD